jgi:hypothetical protein
MRARLIVAVALGLFAWPVLADAQRPANVPQIAILSDETPAVAAKTFESFAQGLRDLGYIEGQNITFARRYAEGRMEVPSEPCRRTGRPSAGRRLRHWHTLGTRRQGLNSDDPDNICADL